MVRRLQANPDKRDAEVVLDGKFRVLDDLGASADLRACAGVHLQTGRAVEIHLLPAGLAASGPEAERLVRAARASGRAPHVNLLNVLDSGTDPAGRPYVVYERFDAENAAELVRREGPFPMGEAGQVMSQLLAALEALHTRGVIHRFLRPDSVLIERRASGAPRVKLTGFGYALASSKAAATAKVPDLPRGYSRFLAPEVRRGESSTTPGIDIYAAGVLMRFLLTGDTDPQAELDPIAARAIEHATAEDPDERFLSADTFASAVGLLLPEQDGEHVPPADTDPLAADLKYMHLRRARESGICDTPTGEGRVNLIPVLLMVEAIYARSGSDGWQRIAAEVPDVELLLPAAGRREHYMEQGVPMELVSRMLAAADQVDGAGDLRSLAEIGEALVKRGLSRFCKELPAEMSPDGLVDCVPVIWSSLARHGEVVVLERKAQGARLGVRAQVEPSLELCAVMAGLLRAQIRATGSEGEVNTVACQALGDAADIFVLSWS